MQNKHAKDLTNQSPFKEPNNTNKYKHPPSSILQTGPCPPRTMRNQAQLGRRPPWPFRWSRPIQRAARSNALVRAVRLQRPVVLQAQGLGNGGDRPWTRKIPCAPKRTPTRVTRFSVSLFSLVPLRRWHGPNSCQCLFECALLVDC